MQPIAKVLYLSYDGMTDPLGQSQVLPYLQGLTAAGYKFTLISFEKPDRFAQGRAEVEGIVNAAGINWMPQLYTKKPPVLSTLLDLRRMQRTAAQICRRQKIDIVHCRSYISALVGSSLKKKYGVKFVFDMRGFWADERVEGGIWNIQNPVYKGVYNFFKRKEKEFFSQADYTISLTEAGKKEIHKWQGIKGQPIPIQVIPCCADLDAFNYENVQPAQVAALQHRLNINAHDFVITYLGSIGTWYMLDEMLGFFKCLLERRADAKFVFITNEPPGRILQRAGALGVPAKALIITPARRSEVPLFLALGQWSIFFIKPIFSKLASSPTKQGEIMGMGIPHICNTGVGDVERILEDGHCGVVVKSFDTPAYNFAISQILNGGFNAQAIRKGAFRFYSLQKGVESYIKVYKTINE